MTNKSLATVITEFLDIEDLKADLYVIAKDGYTKGLQVGKNQLAPLNVKVETSLMGNNLSPDKLKKIKDLNAKYIEGWKDRFSQKIYDTVYDGLESGKTLKQITDDIMTVTDKGILEAKKEAAGIIIDAARRGEIELYREMKVNLYRDIAIVDNRTCGVCLALNGRIYEDATDDRGMMNYDSGEFLRDEIEQLKEENGYEDWDALDPEQGKEGPPYHSPTCRCMFAPVLTFEQYKGVVQTTISEV